MRAVRPRIPIGRTPGTEVPGASAALWCAIARKRERRPEQQYRPGRCRTGNAPVAGRDGQCAEGRWCARPISACARGRVGQSGGDAEPSPRAVGGRWPYHASIAGGGRDPRHGGRRGNLESTAGRAGGGSKAVRLRLVPPTDVENARTAGMKKDGEHRKTRAGTAMDRRRREATGKGPALVPIGWTDVEWPPGNAVEVHHELLDAGDREGAAKWLADVSVDVLARPEEEMDRR